jgi:hypothetical protein
MKGFSIALLILETEEKLKREYKKERKETSFIKHL